MHCEPVESFSTWDTKLLLEASWVQSRVQLSMPRICWANSSVFAIQPFRMQIISFLIRCKNNEIHRNIHLDRFAQCIHYKVFEKFIQPLSFCASHKLVNLMVGNSIHILYMWIVICANFRPKARSICLYSALELCHRSMWFRENSRI